MTKKQYQLKNYLSVQKVGDIIYSGNMPPVGNIIEQIPEYLPLLIKFLNETHTEKEILNFLQTSSSLTKKESELIFNELLEYRIIGEVFYSREDRYSRHSLYYDLINVYDSKNSQKILSNKTIGLIGMGGIGSNVAMNLAAAGVGTLVFSDGDKIEVSNLTRQYLYREDNIGEYKVDVAMRKLQELNSNVTCFPIYENISSLDFFYKNSKLAECDFIIISADSPSEIHDWINDASINLGFAYSNAGYIEKYGVVGPLVIPGKTACYECFKQSEQRSLELESEELNNIFQAPSYGPLNSIVAAIQSNEIIRFLLGKDNKTLSNRLLIDSEHYKIFEEYFERRDDCASCSMFYSNDDPSTSENNEHSLADIYTSKDMNLNEAILNPLMKKIISLDAESTLLEIGAATGSLGSYYLNKGVYVDFNELSEEMANKIPNTSQAQLYIGDFLSIDFDKTYDLVICNNVLDYIGDLKLALAKLKGLLKSDGKLYLTVPHPIKDTGFWNKEKYNGRWNYEEYVIKDYFKEGKVKKQRESSSGEVISNEIISNHRTISTYTRNILESGFTICDIIEAEPEQNLIEDYPILFEKSYNVPYFLTFVLKK